MGASNSRLSRCLAGEVGDLLPFIGELTAPEAAQFYALSARVFACPERFGFASGDEAAEAFIRYKTRIRTILQKSLKLPGNRDAYLDVCIRYLAKSIQRSIRKKEMVDVVLESAGNAAFSTMAQWKDDSGSKGLPDGERLQFIADIAPSYFLARMDADSKRLLYLVLKCAWEVDDDLAEKAARKLGVPLVWLCSLLQQARSSIESSRLYCAKLNERINILWVKMRVIEAQLQNDNLKPELRQKLLERSESFKKRYTALLDKRSRCKLLVSNRAIASLLHVPKGSVDSGIFYLKAEYKGKLAQQ